MRENFFKGECSNNKGNGNSNSQLTNPNENPIELSDPNCQPKDLYCCSCEYKGKVWIMFGVMKSNWISEIK